MHMNAAQSKPVQDQGSQPEKGSRILIIEDEKPLADGVAYNLRREGFEVVHCVDGKDGLARAKEIIPDYILLDLMLPSMQGTEILRELKAHTPTSRIPVIIISTEGKEEDTIRGLKMGAKGYVKKPFQASELHSLIEKITSES